MVKTNVITPVSVSKLLLRRTNTAPGPGGKSKLDVITFDAAGRCLFLPVSTGHGTRSELEKTHIPAGEHLKGVRSNTYYSSPLVAKCGNPNGK